VRNPKQAEVEILKKKIDNCIKAAGLATGCRVEIKWIMQYLDMQNSKL
jgi:metal-dependent amidase/aminoacylase/carboxypeptidase family protein